MPAYQFYRLPALVDDAPPLQLMLFSDMAAMRVALSAEFPTGCDVWQGRRFVGQFHPPSARAIVQRQEDEPPSVS